MKKIFLLFVLVSPLLCKAQPFELIFDNPWYLEQMQINGNYYQIPYNTEISNVTLHFYDTTPYTFSLEVCRTLSGEITYPNFDTMLFPFALSETGTPCSLGDNSVFETDLFIYFENLVGVEFFYDYTFVDPDPPNYYVTLNFSNGDYLEFNEVANSVLSTEDFNKKRFSVFPNPVKDKIQVRNLGSQKISEMRLLSLQGIVLVETENDFINMKPLSKGMYLLEMTSEDGSRQIEKILKK